MSVSVDQILQRMITDAHNLDPNLNISQGTETYIRFATNASAIWGLYKQYDWTVDQIFPSTMSKESLEKYATERGKDVSEMTGADILEFVIQYLRKPPSGGKSSDYERWALETVSNGSVVPMQASMVKTSSSTITVNAANLIDPKKTSTIGFAVGSSDVNKYVIIDFGSSKSIFGIGLGFTTYRNASFDIYSSTDGSAWTKRTTLNTSKWSMDDFDAVDARYWKIVLKSIASLESWQTASLNTVKCYGIEFYTDDTVRESADYAKTIANGKGVGTMSILLAPVTLSMRLMETVRKHCEDEGPVAPREIFVSVQRESTVNLYVDIDVDGDGDMNEEAFRSDVEKYFAELHAGDIFVKAQIIVFAIKNGATNATVSYTVSGTSITADSYTPDAEEKLVLGELTEV